MGLQLVTAPTFTPLAQSDAKLHARIAFDDEDPLVSQLLAVVQEFYEKIADQKLCTQTWDQFWHTVIPDTAHLSKRQDVAPTGADRVRLDNPPLQSVVFVKYIDQNGATQTLDPTLYQVDTTRQRGFIVPASGQVWPELQPQTLNAFNVRFVCGFTAANIPATAVHFIRHGTALLFKEEGREGVEALLQDGSALESLLWSERSLEFV